MKDLIGAMGEEQEYVSERMNGIDTALMERLKPYGYDSLSEYFRDKREYKFNEWKPEVYRVEIGALSEEVEAAIRNEKYGVYIPFSECIHAFHGNDEIDYALCKELGICVSELHYIGGTIIGSPADFAVYVVAPNEIGLDAQHFIKKYYEIISRYVDGAEIAENDILVNGEKVMGSMRRVIGSVFVWAAQVSFGEYSDIIAQVCNKKSGKNPGHIDSNLLTRDTIEREVIAWLQKR